MAHADYNCCAICDCKLTYSGFDSSTKESICPDCIELTMSLETPCVRPSQIIEHLRSLDDTAALAWLHAIGFEPCYYENDVDKYVIERGLVQTGIKDGPKWGKQLRPISPTP